MQQRVPSDLAAIQDMMQHNILKLMHRFEQFEKQTAQRFGNLERQIDALSEQISYMLPFHDAHLETMLTSNGDTVTCSHTAPHSAPITMTSHCEENTVSDGHHLNAAPHIFHPYMPGHFVSYSPIGDMQNLWSPHAPMQQMSQARMT